MAETQNGGHSSSAGNVVASGFMAIAIIVVLALAVGFLLWFGMDQWKKTKVGEHYLETTRVFTDDVRDARVAIGEAAEVLGVTGSAGVSHQPQVLVVGTSTSPGMTQVLSTAPTVSSASPPPRAVVDVTTATTTLAGSSTFTKCTTGARVEAKPEDKPAELEQLRVALRDYLSDAWCEEPVPNPKPLPDGLLDWPYPQGTVPPKNTEWTVTKTSFGLVRWKTVTAP